MGEVRGEGDLFQDVEASHLNMRQAAALLGVSEDTISRRIKSGLLPARKLAGGKDWILLKKDVLGLVIDPRGRAGQGGNGA